MTIRSTPTHCSFCDKNKDRVGKLIVSHNVAICNECVDLCNLDYSAVEKYEDKSYEVLNPNTTNILSDILSDDIARTPTFGANSILNIPGREVAVKTGTTNNNKDAWTIGYTPSVAVGVWVGNNDNKPMKKGGSAVAGPIWNKFMIEALKIQPNETFEKPELGNNPQTTKPVLDLH